MVKKQEPQELPEVPEEVTPPMEGTPEPEGETLEGLKQQLEQLRVDLEQKEQNLRSAQGVTRKQGEEIQNLRDTSSRIDNLEDLVQIMVAQQAAQKGLSETDYLEEPKVKGVDIVKQVQQARLQREYQQKINSYQKRTLDSGLSPMDGDYWVIKNLVESGLYSQADTKLEQFEKTKPEPPKEKPEPKETEDERIERKAKELLIKQGLIPTGASGPSAGGEPSFTENQIADREFYEKNREAILKAYQEGRITK